MEREPKNNKTLFHAMAEASADAIINVNSKGTVVLWNRSAESMFGHERNEIVGRNITAIMPERYRSNHKRAMKRFFATGEGAYIGHTAELEGLRKDGQEFPIELTLSAWDHEGEICVTGIIRDTTKRKQAEGALRQANRALYLTKHSSKAMVKAEDEFSLTKKICRQIVEKAGYRFAWVGYALHDKDKTVQPAAQFGPENDYLQTFKATWADNELGQGPTGRAIRTRKPQICRDLKHGSMSAIALPLTFDGDVFGALNIYAGKRDAFDEDETRILQEVAADLGYGIRLLRLRSAHLETEAELLSSKNLLEETFSTLGEAVFLIDAENRLITECNKAAERIFGYDRQEMVGRNTEFMHVDENAFQKFGRKIYPILEDAGKCHGELNLKRKNGEIFSCEYTLTRMVESSGRTTIVSVVRDIDQRKRDEEALRQKEHEIRKAYATVFSAVTGDKLFFMTSEEIAAALGNPVSETTRFTNFEDLAKMRSHIRDIMRRQFPHLREADMSIVASGEAMTNSVKHAGGGQVKIYAKEETAQIAVTDFGPGIDFSVLPKATLVPGFSTKQSLGLGFSLMLEICDRVLLTTQPGFTEIVLEIS